MLNGNRKLKIKSRDGKIINRKNNLQNEIYNKPIEIKSKEKPRPNTKDYFNRRNSQQKNNNKEHLKNNNRDKPKDMINKNNDKMNVKVDNINYNKMHKNLKKENPSGKKRLTNNLNIIYNSNNKKQKIFLAGKNIPDELKKENKLNNLQKIEIKNDSNNTLDTNFSRSLKPSHNNGRDSEEKNGIKIYNIFDRNNNDNDNQKLPNIRQNSFKKGVVNLNLLKLHQKQQLNQKQNRNHHGPLDDNINHNLKIKNNDNKIINLKIKNKNNLINIRYGAIDNNNHLPKLHIMGNKKLKLLNNFLKPPPEIKSKSKNNNLINIKEKKPIIEKRTSKSSACDKLTSNQNRVANNLINNDINDNCETPRINNNSNNNIELKEEESLKPDNYINNNINNNNIRENEQSSIEYYHKEDMNKGCYETMEDFTLVKSPFFQGYGHNMSLFAVFDGHGGKDVSEYLMNNFSEQLLEAIKKNFKKSFTEILKQTILDIDEKIKSLEKAKTFGSTGTIVIIDNYNKIYCANVGDSKCYYIDNKESIQLSEDHNCKNPKEVELVKKSGGLVFQGRVFGSLMLTRSFGDFDYKSCGITAIPYIVRINKDEKNVKFVVLASDGVWDVVNNEKLYKMSLENGNSAKELCEKLVNYALENHSTDNISCIVIKI